MVRCCLAGLALAIAMAGCKTIDAFPARPRPATAVVPDVSNQSDKEAALTLLESGLATGQSTVRRMEPGTVLEQSPPPGTKVPAGTPVDLVVVETPSMTTFEFNQMPMRKEEPVAVTQAAAALPAGRCKGAACGKDAARSAHRPRPASAVANGRAAAASIPLSKPIGQSPAVAASPAARDESLASATAKAYPVAVAKVVADAAPEARPAGASRALSVAVPNLLRTAMGRAQESLQRAGLAIGQVKRQTVPAAPPGGIVLQQMPEPGTQVAPATRIDLLVAVPPG